MNAVISGRIERLERSMLSMPQAACNVRHIFGPGLYIRELSIPAGTYAIGHYQKTEHMNVMICGSVTIVNDDGSHTLLSAPLTFVAKPGRKVGYVHEDMVWQNIYATEETDIEKLEAIFLEKSEAFNSRQKLIEYANDGDYAAMLSEVGADEETVRKQSENEADQIPFPFGCYKVKVGRSNIEGRGLVATADIAAGEIVCPARLGGFRTPAGRYTNHAKNPNAEMVAIDGDVYLAATRNISGCVGGEDGEEITVDYRRSVDIAKGLSE